MKPKMILLILGGLVLVIVIALVALLVPIHQSGETKTEEQTIQPTQEDAMEPMNTNTPKATQLPTEQTTITVNFSTTDGLTVTADLYWTGDANAAVILLFHQANYSRGEYQKIAPKLNALGYNCLAIDQRSGGTVNGVVNETNKAAKTAGLPTAYPDAYADLQSALSYVESTYAPKKLIVWGSSYSSSLALILASEHPSEIAAVLAFSPGEYFKLDGKQIADYAANITQPAFITSAKSEEKAWRGIANVITSSGSVFFVPKESGHHGSSALIDQTPNHAEYWTAVEGFLASLK